MSWIGTPATRAALKSVRTLSRRFCSGNATTGRVHTLVSFTNLKVDYVISSSSREQVISAGTQVKGALRVIAENSEGTNRDYYLPSVTLAPNGDFVLKGDGTNWLTMKLDMEVLKKDDSTAAVYIDGRAA